MEKHFIEDLKKTIDLLREKMDLSGQNEVLSALNTAREKLEDLEERMDRFLVKDSVLLERAGKLERDLWVCRKNSLLSRIQRMKAELRKKDLELERFRERSLTVAAGENAQTEKIRKMAEKQRRSWKISRHACMENLRKAFRSFEKMSEEDDSKLSSRARCGEDFERFEDLNLRHRIYLLLKEDEFERERRNWSLAKENVEENTERSDELRAENMEVIAKYKASRNLKVEDQGATESDQLERVLEEADTILAAQQAKEVLRESISEKEEKELEKKNPKEEQKAEKKKKSFWRRFLCCCSA